MSEQVNNIIAVEGNTDQAGAVVYWSLSGEIEFEQFRALWDAANLAEELLPETPSPETALRRAMKEQQKPRRLVRPLKKGWAIMAEDAANEELEYTQLLRASINKIGHLVVENVVEGEKGIADAIAATFTTQQDTLSQSDISSWLARMVRKCQAVALRERGGIYFIPFSALGHWRAMTEVLSDASGHTCFEIPALKTEQAIDAILASLVREAQDAVSEMETELMEGDMQKRALRTREDRCSAMMAKLGSYETLLGRNMDAMSKKVEDLKISIGAAMLAGMKEL